jgi:hypothetical protein
MIWGKLFLRNPAEYVSPTPLPDERNKSSIQNIVFFRMSEDKILKIQYLEE